MLNLIHKNHMDIKDNILEILNRRKNFIFYDGLMDGLSNDVKYKFFYSNPHDALEFIILDVFYKAQIKNICDRSVETFGVIETVKEVDELPTGLTESIFGYTLIEEVEIRSIKKYRASLYINKNGLNDIENTINYFENYICNKGI